MLVVIVLDKGLPVWFVLKVSSLRQWVAFQ